MHRGGGDVDGAARRQAVGTAVVRSSVLLCLHPSRRWLAGFDIRMGLAENGTRCPTVHFSFLISHFAPPARIANHSFAAHQPLLVGRFPAALLSCNFALR